MSFFQLTMAHRVSDSSVGHDLTSKYVSHTATGAPLGGTQPEGAWEVPWRGKIRLNVRLNRQKIYPR